VEVIFKGRGEVPDDQLRFAVIAAKKNGEWIFCRHRERQTWELPGGRRESGESIEQTAHRELMEETGAAEFDLNFISIYSVVSETGTSSGALFIAEVRAIGPLSPEFEIAERRITSVFPTDWTYPEIQPALFRQIQNWLNLQTSSDELWDIYDENRQRTGRFHRRGDPMQPGEWHLGVDVWVLNSHGEYLLTQRAPNKGYPLFWEPTGGSALAGDDSLQAALRELREETGLVLSPDAGKLWRTFTGGDCFKDVWIFRHDFDPSKIIFQPGETVAARSASPAEILRLRDEGRLVPCRYLDELLSSK